MPRTLRERIMIVGLNKADHGRKCSRHPDGDWEEGPGSTSALSISKRFRRSSVKLITQRPTTFRWLMLMRQLERVTRRREEEHRQQLCRDLDETMTKLGTVTKNFVTTLHAHSSYIKNRSANHEQHLLKGVLDAWPKKHDGNLKGASEEPQTLWFAAGWLRSSGMVFLCEATPTPSCRWFWKQIQASAPRSLIATGRWTPKESP
ncbi:hypothetical protein DFS34DRAFT_421422 [Phlyctochytrium arcticum]|nr:hypothetical protein DFS34DRAFT_421422 [Phlyctochytrium arcticum]